MTEKLVPLSTILERTGHMSPTTIWRMRRKKQFSEPVSISPNRKAWRESDINAWVDARSSGEFADSPCLAA